MLYNQLLSTWVYVLKFLFRAHLSRSGIKLSDWKVHISSPMLDIARLLPKELFRQNVIIFPQLTNFLDEGEKFFVNLKGMKLFIFISS